jgi:outer membrane receptor protein involved in Fe transport
MHIMDNIELTLGISYDAQDLEKFQKKKDINGSTEMIDQYQAMDDSTIWGTRDSFNPVAGVVYEPIMDFLKLRSAASRKTSFPTLQAYSKTLSPYKESSDLGSRDTKIKPEKSFNSNTGFEFLFFNKQLTLGSDYFYSRYDDRITKIYVTKSDDYIYRNIDSEIIHGAETILKLNKKNILDIANIYFSLTYTYIFARNQADVDNSFVNKGDKSEKIPEHKFTSDFRMYFKTDTSLVIFGYFEYNQIQYTMNSVPKSTAGFSTSYFCTQRLHNPLMIDIKLSQMIYNHFEVYVMCKNVLDDYAADPFNPGPGRMFYGGVNGKF